jgi:hypothetical protein
MPDDKKKKGQPDAIRINPNEDYEVSESSKKLGGTPNELKKAIRKIEETSHPSFAHMPSPLLRCSSAVLLSLASHRDGGLRLFRTSSAFTLRFSRLTRRSLILWPARSLIAFSATFCTEGFARRSCPLRTLRLLPAGATVAGWVILLPLELRALFTAHTKSCAKELSSSSSASLRWPQLALGLQVAAHPHIQMLVTEGESRARSSFVISASVAALAAQ